MCVDTCKAGSLTRAEVIASFAGASLLAFGKPAAAATKPKRFSVQLPPVSSKRLSSATRRAAGIALASGRVMQAWAELYGLAHSIGESKLRSDTMSLIANPIPRYGWRLRDTGTRERLRGDLVAAGFIDRADAIDHLLPDATHDFAEEAQPFIATAGSAQDSHHAYPGGLVLHELFNARAAVALADNYDREYFGGRRTISRDVVVAAALYHDVMKTVVFQWGDDGKLSVEPNIAGTGAHHVLSAAEAIVRGRDARFVTVVLSAHAAPSLGDEVKVVAWARAAAMVAGVDPVDYGLLKRKGDGFELAAIPPIEAFINNLSDHDYVLSVHAIHEVAPRVDATIAAAGAAEDRRLWYRNALLANVTAIGLYQILAHDEKQFHASIERELSKISLTNAI